MVSLSLFAFEFYLPFLGFWAKALPAAVLLADPVRLSRRTFDAAFAALELVCLVFLGMSITSSLIGTCMYIVFSSTRQHNILCFLRNFSFSLD